MFTERSSLCTTGYEQLLPGRLDIVRVVRHETLMSKMAQLIIPDNIYNWIKEFFKDSLEA